MKKFFTVFAALALCAGVWAKDVTGTNVYRYVYPDYASGNPYYSLQINDADWNTYCFGFKDAKGPMVGETYTIDDMIADQTYVSINYEQDAVSSLTLTRSYEGLQEKFNATVTTQSGEQYDISWAAQVPAEMGADVDLDTTIVCDLRDYGSYKTFTPMVNDYNYYDFTIAFTSDLPRVVGETLLYKWKNNTVYIGNANFSLPNDWNTKPFDILYDIKGIDGGWEGTAEYSMTDGHKYKFNFIYTIPVAKETVNLSGYDLKINNLSQVVFAWQGEGYSLNLTINSADTIGNWKGDDIILSNCSFQYTATYTDLGVYAIDSIYVTKTEEGYIRLQTSILCKNNTLYVLDITTQESPYYVKYDVDGTGVKWNYIPAAQYGTGRAMGLRFNNDSIWFNAEPTDEGAAGFSIKEAYGTYGDPLWEKDSISISYDANNSWGSPLNVYMAEKYYDGIWNVELSSRSYENVEGDGVWNYSFTRGSYVEGNRYSFNFGIISPIHAPKQYITYTLSDMTDDYRTKGYDPDSNEIKYDVVSLNRELDWYANEAEKITTLVHTTGGKAYKLIYAADTIPTAIDTIHITTKASLRQLEYWFQFEGESVNPSYRVKIALGKEEVTPTTYYWKQNEIYKPGTLIYNNGTDTYVDIADGWVQVYELKEEEQLVGYKCEAYLLGYDKHCYHSCLTYIIGTPTEAPAAPTVTGATSVLGVAMENNLEFSFIDWGAIPTKLMYDGVPVDFFSNMTWAIYSNWEEEYYDMSEYSTLHIDLYPTVDSKIKVTIEDLSADDGGNSYKDGVVKELKANVWNTLDINVSEFPGVTEGVNPFEYFKYLILEGFKNLDDTSADGTPLSVGNVYFYGATTGLNNIKNEKVVTKFLHNGQIIIRKGDKHFNALGVELPNGESENW